MSAKGLVLHFAKAWEQRYRRRYPISWGKEIAIFKRLLDFYTPQELASYTDFYILRLNDDFADRAGRSIGVFVGLLPRVVAAVAREVEAAEKAGARDGDWERLEKARRGGK